MVHIDILIRTNRKSISISVSPQGEVIIKAPKSCSLSSIQQIVDKKENWINLHREKVLNNQTLNKGIFEYSDILFCGQVYHIVYDDKIQTSFAQSLRNIGTAQLKKCAHGFVLQSLAKRCAHVKRPPFVLL